jgi:Putative porin
MIRKDKYTLVLAGLVALTTSAALADDQALIDALVRKGILTQKDADKIESEVSKNPALVQPPSSPLKLAPWIKELKLSGDLRLRYQWDEEQTQEPSAAPAIPTPTPSPSLRNPTPTLTASPNGRNHIAQRDRWRFRLRLNAEIKFDNGFFGGFSLTTNNFADTANQTYTGGFQNYGIYISKAFLGWNGYPGLAIIAGKQDNPFYTTDLFYDPNIYPQGLVERIDFDKLFGWNSAGEPVSYSKEGKAPPPAPARHPSVFELSLIAGQFIFYDNNEYNFDSDLKNDSYLFEEQLLARYRTDWFAITFGPSLFIANAAGYGHDTVANGPAGNFSSVNGGGFTAPAKTDFLQFLDGTGEERDLFIVLAPGDITVKVANIPVRFYWDFAYNFDGGARFSLLGTAGQRATTATLFSGTSLSTGTLVLTQRDGTNPVTFPFAGLYSQVVTDSHGNVIAFKNLAQPSDKDKMAWLVGLKIGDNKKAGDLSAYVDYRQVGIASIDPNLSNSDVMDARLNSQGFGFGINYNVTDFFILGVSGRYDWNLTNLYGGQATRGSGIADLNTWHYIRVDALLKF